MKVIRLDRERLEQLAEVKFGWSDIQQFVELATIFAERYHERSPTPDFMLADSVLQTGALGGAVRSRYRTVAHRNA